MHVNVSKRNIFCIAVENPLVIQNLYGGPVTPPSSICYTATFQLMICRSGCVSAQVMNMYHAYVTS